MVRCGELCKSCTGGCNELYADGSYSDLECVECNGSGCNACGSSGVMRLDKCPRELISSEMIEAINLAGISSNKGILPAAGGLLDQGNWFVDLMTRLDSETNKIDAERMERMNNV